MTVPTLLYGLVCWVPRHEDDLWCLWDSRNEVPWGGTRVFKDCIVCNKNIWVTLKVTESVTRACHYKMVWKNHVLQTKERDRVCLYTGLSVRIGHKCKPTKAAMVKFRWSRTLEPRKVDRQWQPLSTEYSWFSWCNQKVTKKSCILIATPSLTHRGMPIPLISKKLYKTNHIKKVVFVCVKTSIIMILRIPLVFH